MSERLRVELGERSYDIVIGERLIVMAGGYIKPLIKSDSVIIVSDENVAPLYMKPLTTALEESGIRCRSVILPPGENTKNFTAFGDLLERLLACAPNRKTTLIALGGGVIGDITGFAASVLLRGVDYIQIPTTLLAQVDSSVGGKTGINSARGKNLIGSFHQPRLVLCDISTLTTLPEREKRAGYAEIVKYGLINDAAFFAWLEENGEKILAGDTAAITYAISTSCRAKAEIVAQDERESGARALLNFGHTFGHALEAECGYDGTLLHGEAVAIGMALAFRTSVKKGLCPPDDETRVISHIRRLGLPASPPDIHPVWDTENLIHLMTQDKKAESERLAFILTRGIGQAFIARDIEKSLVKQVLVEVLSGV